MCANSLGFNMILGVQAGAEGVVLEAHGGAGFQIDLDLTSVFSVGKVRFREFEQLIGGTF